MPDDIHQVPGAVARELDELHPETLTYWLRKLVFRGAWLDHRVKAGLLDISFDEGSGGFAYRMPSDQVPLVELAGADVHYEPPDVADNRWQRGRLDEALYFSENLVSGQRFERSEPGAGREVRMFHRPGGVADGVARRATRVPIREAPSCVRRESPGGDPGDTIA